MDNKMVIISLKSTNGAAEHVINIFNDKYRKILKHNRFKFEVNIILDELVVNICNYSFENRKGKILVMSWISEETKTLNIRLIDNGKKFNILEEKDPDIKENLNDRAFGGLGIFIVKKLSDRIQYRFINKFNVITIEKKIIDFDEALK